SSRLRDAIRRIRPASIAARTLALLQSDAPAPDAAPGRTSPQTHPPHAFGVVSDAWHSDAHDPGRRDRPTAHTNDSLLSGCGRSRHCGSRPLEGQNIFRPEVARGPDPG